MPRAVGKSVIPDDKNPDISAFHFYRESLVARLSMIDFRMAAMVLILENQSLKDGQ